MEAVPSEKHGIPENRLALIKQELKTGTLGIPMGPGSLLLVILVFTIITGAVALMLATGTFTAGLTQSKMIVENELLHASQEISQRYGQISQQSVEFQRQCRGHRKELKTSVYPFQACTGIGGVEEILSISTMGPCSRCKFQKQRAFLILTPPLIRP